MTQRDEQNLQKKNGRNNAQIQAVLREILPHFVDKQWAADCWPWSAPIADVEMDVYCRTPT